MIKVAHVNYYNIGEIPIGVKKKLGQQALAAKKISIDLDFIILNPSLALVDDNLKFIKFKALTSNVFLHKLEKFFFQFPILEKNIDWDKYDYVILRYPGMGLFAVNFINKFGYKIITEHHTNEIGELSIRKQKLSGKFKIFLEKMMARSFLSKVKGIVGVTEEIRNIEISKCKCDTHSYVVSNGIDVSSIPLNHTRKFDGKKLNIVFVASTFGSPHGLDRVLRGLKNYTGNILISLNLVGKVNKNDIKMINKINNDFIEINILGKQYGVELDNIFNKSNIAIGSLTLFRKNMKEACTLKIREYIARGIPFVYGHDDSDLAGDETFAYKVPANEEPIDITELIDFATKVSADSNMDNKMREFAKQNLDWTIKVGQLYSFVQSLDFNK